MVIRYDDVQPVFLRPQKRFEAPDTTIHGYHKLHAVREGFREVLDIQSIPFSKSIRDVKRGPRPETHKRLPQKCRPGRPVYVIVAPDQYFLPALNRRPYPGDRGIHSF